MKKTPITEEMKVHEQWFVEAKKQTMETLPIFLNHLMNDYGHDYGTICHAITAGGIATMWAMNDAPQGGITGFQAGCVMWGFIRHWNNEGNKTGLRLVDYDNFLYPQYEDKFQKVISPDIWSAIQKEARKNVEEADKYHADYLIKKQQWDIDIAVFIAKYPDYNDRPEYYEYGGCKTGAEHEEDARKKEAGFEFAPNEPYKGIKGNPVYYHWMSIINGIVPFGYKVGKED